MHDKSCINLLGLRSCSNLKPKVFFFSFSFSYEFMTVGKLFWLGQACKEEKKKKLLIWRIQQIQQLSFAVFSIFIVSVRFYFIVSFFFFFFNFLFNFFPPFFNFFSSLLFLLLSFTNQPSSSSPSISHPSSPHHQTPHSFIHHLNRLLHPPLSINTGLLQQSSDISVTRLNNPQYTWDNFVNASTSFLVVYRHIVSLL